MTEPKSTEARSAESLAVWARAWMDVYRLEPETQVQCPDCEELSPVVYDAFAAVKWAEAHSKECPA